MAGAVVEIHCGCSISNIVHASFFLYTRSHTKIQTRIYFQADRLLFWENTHVQTRGPCIVLECRHCFGIDNPFANQTNQIR